MDFDELNRPLASDALKQAISQALADVPADKRGALLVLVKDGKAQATLAARLGSHWKVAGGLYADLGETRPNGYVACEASW